MRELGPLTPETVKARVRLLGVHRFRGRTRQLRRELDELLPVLRADPQAMAESLVVALRNKTHLELDEGRLAEAEAAAEEGLRVAGERLGLRHNETVAASLMQALVALNGKDPALALDRTERAYGLTLELFPAEPNHARRIEAQNLYGRALANAGEVARGAEHVASAVERAGEVFGPSSRMVGVFSRQLARYQLQLGEIERALETSRRSVEISTQHTEQDSFRHADAQLVHGECLLAAFRPAEAASFLAPAVEVLRARQGPSHPRTVNAGALLAIGVGARRATSTGPGPSSMRCYGSGAAASRCTLSASSSGSPAVPRKRSACSRSGCRRSRPEPPPSGTACARSRRSAWRSWSWAATRPRRLRSTRPLRSFASSTHAPRPRVRPRWWDGAVRAWRRAGARKRCPPCAKRMPSGARSLRAARRRPRPLGGSAAPRRPAAPETSVSLADEREQQIFCACLEMAPAEQAPYLARACGDDQELRQRLERLLAAHGRAEQSTLSPLGEVLAAPPGPVSGATVGPYRLMRLAGRGRDGQRLARGAHATGWSTGRSP